MTQNTFAGWSDDDLASAADCRPWPPRAVELLRRLKQANRLNTACWLAAQASQPCVDPDPMVAGAPALQAVQDLRRELSVTRRDLVEARRDRVERLGRLSTENARLERELATLRETVAKLTADEAHQRGIANFHAQTRRCAP